MLDTVWFESSRIKYLLGIDILKIYAIIMVVLTHCYEPAFVQSRFAEIWIYNSVPIFLIVASFSYSHKYYKIFDKASPFGKISVKSLFKGWFNKTNLLRYFDRISVPYLFFMLLEVIILPLIKYTTVDVVLLNTVKGGMGAGAYYLVVYLQLFLLIPFLNALYQKHPLAALAVCFSIQYAWDIILHYALIGIDPAMITDINKFICFRFLLMFFAGMTLFYEFDKIRIEHIALSIAAGFMLTAAFHYIGGTGIYAIDSVFSAVQGVCWCFGIVALFVIMLKNYNKRIWFICTVGGSTLHILLFQQLYFCCVGTARNKAYIDAPVAILCGIAIYIISKLLRKAISGFIDSKKINKNSAV